MNTEKNIITIIGCGYVGLVTGSCLASLGKKVICIDKNKKKIDSLKSGKLTIHEKNLKNIFKQNLNKNLFFSNSLSDSFSNSDISMIAVGTPLKNKKINYEYISNVSVDLAKLLKYKKKHHLIIVKSTILPTTCEKIIIPIIEKISKKKVNVDFSVVVNPEFLREGEAVDDFLNPDRIVIGYSNKKSKNLTRGIYSSFDKNIFHYTNIKTAELIKCASNSLFGTLISFSNEIANLSSKIGNIDNQELFSGIVRDRRISTNLRSGKINTAGIGSYIHPGPGFGGSCLPKDIKSLSNYGSLIKNKMYVLESVIKTNNKQYLKIIEYLKNKKNKHKKIVSILGISFKPNTDDLRDSPSIHLIKKLSKLNYIIKVHDPISINLAKKIFAKNKNIFFSDKLVNTIKKTDFVVVMTYWNEYKKLHTKFKKNKFNPIIIDTRSQFDKNKFINYKSL